MNISPIEMIMHILTPIGVVIASYLAIKTRDLLAAALLFSAASLLLSFEYYILHAPDVAISEAAVGACLTDAILIFAVRATKRMEEE
jgi:uncharacterized MnhB-related membrane protein